LEIVNSLAGGYQMVVKMHLLEGISHEEIAGIMGITPSTARSQYSRALQRIRVIIHEQKRQHV
jgi:RNA polymerase sigma-70 factor (ECF subfamily)